MTEEYNGPEQRAGYCPVHHLKCAELKETGEMVKGLEKNKLSILMFRVFLGLAVTITGGLWYTTQKDQGEATQTAMMHLAKSNKVLAEHVEKSTITLNAITHGLNEVALNQRKVMKKLQLEFDHLHRYEYPE